MITGKIYLLFILEILMIYKNYKAGFIFVIILSLVLMGVGAKYDYAVTDALYNPQNPVCIRLESVAKLPIIMFIPVLGACVAVRSKNSVAVFGCQVCLQ